MHILYFHQHFSTPDGSAGTRSYEMAQALIKNGHNVTMVCGSYGQGNTGLMGNFAKGVRKGNTDGIKVVEFSLDYSNEMGLLKRTWAFLRFALRSSWLALTEPADLIFATSTPLTAGIPGIMARWLRGRRFVFEVRDLWPELPEAMGVIKNPVVLKLMSLLEWISYKSAHKLVGLSPGIIDGIKRRGIDAERIAFVPNGCDLALFKPDTISQRPPGVHPNSFLAIFAGTHGLANGLDAVLDAAVWLKQSKRTDIQIVLIGRGSEKSKLMASAATEQLENVAFLDPVNKQELARYFAGADVGLQILRNVPAFYYGTSPNKFFDYISAGLPVLNNYPGWIADVISEHNCGIVVEPDNKIDLANALIKLADDRKAARNMGKNARVLAEDQFARDDLAQKWTSWITTS